MWRAWSEAELATLRRLRAGGETDLHRIAAAVGRTKIATEQKLRKIGLGIGAPCRPWTTAALAATREVYEDQAADLAAFAASIGRTVNAIREQAAKYGWRRFRTPWTAEEDAFLRRWYPREDGLPMPELVRRLGRHERQIERRVAKLRLTRSMIRKRDLLSLAAHAQHERARERRFGEAA